MVMVVQTAAEDKDCVFKRFKNSFLKQENNQDFLFMNILFNDSQETCSDDNEHATKCEK